MMKIVISNSIVLIDEWIKVKSSEEVIGGLSEVVITSSQGPGRVMMTYQRQQQTSDKW